MKRVVFTITAILTMVLGHAQESQTVMNFLRLPVSAHVAALGGDNVSLRDDDATLLFHNPALIDSVSDRTLSLNAMTYMEGSTTASAALVRRWGERASWAVSAQYMSYGSMREMTADNMQTGELNAKDIAVGGTMAYLLSNTLTGGITLKMVTSHIGQYSSLAAAVDLGVNYLDMDHDLSVSLVARNLGGQLSAYDDEFERMPLDIQMGVTKRLLNSPLRLHATLVRLNDWEHKALMRHLVMGADIILSPQLYVAMGYNAMRAYEMRVSEDEGESAHGAGFSLGAGLQLQRLKLGVAYAKYHVSASSLVMNFAYSL